MQLSFTASTISPVEPHQAFVQLDLDPEPAYELSFMTSAIALVENGEGLTVLPSSALPAFLPPHLKRMELHAPTMERQICLLERKGRQRSTAAARMIEYLLQFTADWRKPAGNGIRRTLRANRQKRQQT